MGPLEILSKSHNLGLVKVKKKRSKNYGSLQRTLPKTLTNNYKIINYEMNMGDILFMNMDLGIEVDQMLAQNLDFLLCADFTKF